MWTSLFGEDSKFTNISKFKRCLWMTFLVSTRPSSSITRCLGFTSQITDIFALSNTMIPKFGHKIGDWHPNFGLILVQYRWVQKIYKSNCMKNYQKWIIPNVRPIFEVWEFVCENCSCLNKRCQKMFQMKFLWICLSKIVK